MLTIQNQAPKHYADASATIEPIHFLQLMPFCLGNACKYLLRAGRKGSKAEDLKKALDYLRWAKERKERPEYTAFFVAPFFRNKLIDTLLTTEEDEWNIERIVDFDTTIQAVEEELYGRHKE